jgi:type I restriction enzyme M protein
VERCINLLRPGGRLGIVLPESLISSQRYRYVVEYMRTVCMIEAVLGMPENLFKTSGKGGTHTKTCLLLLSRRKKQGSAAPHSVFMAEAKWCGHDSRGRTIPHDDLPEIAARLKQDHNSLHASNLGFVISDDQIRDEILAPRHYDPSVLSAVSQMGDTHDPIRFGDLVDQGIIALSTGDEVGKLAYGTGTIPFIRTSDLSNWELKTDAKHGLSEEVHNRLASKQDVKPSDIFMVRDGTYLIGTCAMVTEADLPLVYQSHIYKIRVTENKLGLTPHLLLALLSSPTVQSQIKSKRVTQDIIDSLGNRIMDLILPFPKKPAARKKISDAVSAVIQKRVEARLLFREIRTLVEVG